MPAPPGRGAIARIRRGAPDASADMIDTPSPVAVCSLVVTGRPGPSPGGFPGSPGSVVGDESPVHAAANNKDGTASVRKRKNMRLTSLSATAQVTTVSALSASDVVDKAVSCPNGDDESATRAMRSRVESGDESPSVVAGSAFVPRPRRCGRCNT